MPIAPSKQVSMEQVDEEPIDVAVGYSVQELSVHMFAVVHYRQLLTAMNEMVDTGANRKVCPFTEQDADQLEQCAKSIRRAIRKAAKQSV